MISVVLDTSQGYRERMHSSRGPRMPEWRSRDRNLVPWVRKNGATGAGDRPASEWQTRQLLGRWCSEMIISNLPREVTLVQATQHTEQVSTKLVFLNHMSPNLVT